MTLEEKLKAIILDKYDTLKSFANCIGLPYTTVDTIFKRGIMKANVVNIIKICNELSLSADALASGRIVYRSEAVSLSDTENALLSTFRSLNEEGREKVLSYVDDLIRTGIYKKHTQSELVQDA